MQEGEWYKDGKEEIKTARNNGRTGNPSRVEELLMVG